MGTIIGDGITFDDDVLLVSAAYSVIPNQVDLTTYLTKTHQAKIIPLMSAGMDGLPSTIWQFIRGRNRRLSGYYPQEHHRFRHQADKG